MSGLAGNPVMDNPMIVQPAKAVSLGKDKSSPAWGWDNEYGKMEIE